jgi:hypothetical protein
VACSCREMSIRSILVPGTLLSCLIMLRISRPLGCCKICCTASLVSVVSCMSEMMDTREHLWLDREAEREA